MVAILGFNFFGEDCDEAANKILKISATHFLSAILDERMTVTIDNRLTKKSGSYTKVNSANVQKLLDPSGAVYSSKQVSFPEGLAYRSYRTITQGETLDHDFGAEIKFRLLDGNERYTRVNIFREGMWITWEAPNLKPSKFAGYKQFDAIILLDPNDSPNEIYQLVRTSEGTDHMEINLNNLNDNKEKRKLVKILSDIGELLKEKIGEAGGTSFTPGDFAHFSFGLVRKAERLPSLGRRRTGNRRGKSKKRGGGTKRGVKKGRPATIPLSAKEIIEDEKVIGFDCYIEEHAHPKIGVRVLRETGSDETCDSLVPNKFFKIMDCDGTISISDDPYEVEMVGNGNFTVKLKDPVPVGIGVLTVDLVVRK